MDERTAANVDTLLSEGFSNRAVARALGIGEASVRRHLAKGAPQLQPGPWPKARLDLGLQDGVVLIGSDAHIWPGQLTTAQRGFMFLALQLNPEIIVLNGDVLDFPQISKHPNIGWEKNPSVSAQISAAQSYLQKLADFEPKHLVWPLGNHDMRYETYLAMNADQYAELKGMHLHDHFPDWQPCWSCWINGDVAIKHRWKSGNNAIYNNVVQSGVSMVTGHLHSLNTTAFTDYRGTRFGVDSGTLSVPYGPQFINYTEDNPVNWRSGGVVLTFKDGRLLWPELFYVIDEEAGLIGFRGEVFHV